MLILALRTDKPEAELFLLEDNTVLENYTWQAHRALAETLHSNIRNLLRRSAHTFQDLQGIVVFEGPGSFTGLRIGITVANTFAATLDIPIVAAQGPDWYTKGALCLDEGKNDHIAMPEYGAPVHITPQKK